MKRKHCSLFPSTLMWLWTQGWCPRSVNAVSSGTHWQCVGVSQLQFWSPSPSFLPLNMVGLPDDHPLSWAFLEESPEVPLQPGPPVLSFSAWAHCWLMDHSQYKHSRASPQPGHSALCATKSSLWVSSCVVQCLHRTALYNQVWLWTWCVWCILLKSV